jgi:tungstate transport system ATP-binding protein
MSEALLSIRGLKKSYNWRKILSVKTIAAHRGTCVLLRGANGSGKTTLLKIIAGLLRPDSVMTWKFNGLSQKPSQHGIRSVAYLHQTPYMFIGSVRDNISFAARYAGESATVVEAALKKSELVDVAGASAQELSGGMQQRLAMARIWAAQAKLYLLDEPTAYMDSDSVTFTQALITNMLQQGATVIVAAHDDIGNFPFTETWELQDSDVLSRSHNS